MADEESHGVLREINEGRVRTLLFNRPEALNAINNALFVAVRDALNKARKDDSVAAVILSGEGRAFCAGLDLAAVGEEGSGQFPGMFAALNSFDKPLIGAVNGLGVGVGMTMLAYCDLVVMAQDARLRTPFPQLGLAPEAGSSYTFPARLGWQNAAYVLMSGRWFSAQECLDMGLIWKVTSADSVMPEAQQVALELAANPIPSLIATKSLMLAAGRQEGAMAAHKRENDAYAVLMGGAANAEAFLAFKEKREPNFSNIEGL